MAGSANLNRIRAMMEAVFLGIGILVGGVAGLAVGKRRGERKVQGQVETLLHSLRSGEPPEGDPDPSREVSSLRELRGLLGSEWSRRGDERDRAIRDAFRRVAHFLRHRVEVPLLEGLSSGGRELRAGADAALEAMEDLEFFLEDPQASPSLGVGSLVDLVQEVTREFASQSKVLVKVTAPQDPVRVRVDPEPFKDAVFLVLHNAAEFGGGAPVGVSVLRLEGRGSVRVRDRGPGFTPESMQRAFDPLYSTSPGGLGLGLPYARKALTAQGGAISLRNREEGGAEVEILLPLAD